MRSITCVVSALTLAVLGCGAATAADAAITINITNTAAGVLVQGSGSFNTTGLNGTAPVSSAANGLNGETAVVRFGTGFSQGSFNIFTLSGPTSFGSASPYRVASTAVGDAFGVVGSLNQLLLPSLYVSGTALTGTLTFLNQTIDGLGLTAGTYSYIAGVDTLTVNIEGEVPPPPVAAVPEPATWGMMILGFGAVGASMRRRKSDVRTSVRFA